MQKDGVEEVKRQPDATRKVADVGFCPTRHNTTRQTMLTLGVSRGLASLVLGDLVDGVLAALLGRAESAAGLGDVDLRRKNKG